jgi:hypothetical protein
MNGLTIDIPIWTGNCTFSPGDTPFGYFDYDFQFQLDAPKVADFCARRLGYPMMDVELQSGSFFACFEQATSEFGNIINEYNIVDNFINLQGSAYNSNSNLSQKNIAPNLGRTLQLSKEYGSEAGVGGRITWRSGSLSCYSGQQNYNINTLFRDLVHPNEDIEIKRIFHDGPPAIVRYFDPFVGTGMGTQQMLQSFGWGSYSPGVSFLMMPMYSDLLRLQAIEFNDMIRRSSYSFELINNQLKLFPIPTYNFILYFQYIVESDRNAIDNITTSGVVSDMSNAPFNKIQYGDVNDVGKQWILKYTLALATETLGNVRNKYDSIPIPNAEIRMNGADLVTQGRENQTTLVTDLRGALDKVSRQAQLEKQQAENDAVQTTLNKIPLKIYVGGIIPFLFSLLFCCV